MTLLHGVAAFLEGLQVVPEHGDEGVDAAVAEVGRRQEQHPLRGEVGRHEVAGAPRPEVQLVERERQPAVHLHVRAHHVLEHGARGQPLLLGGAGGREVDEGLEVAAVHPRHLVVDRLRRVLQRPAQQVARRGPRERPQHQVAEVLRRPAHPVPPVHGYPDRRGLAGAQVARARHGAPEVREDGLEPAERPPAPLRGPGAEPRDEVLGEVRLVDDDVAFGAVVSVMMAAGGGGGRRPVVLPAAVVVLRASWRGPRLEEVLLVVHWREAHGQPPGGAAPRDEEVAGGVAVGDDVLGREPDGEGAAAEPRELQHHHLLVLRVQVRVQLEQRRRGLGRRHVDEVGVHGRLHEARAAVVQDHGRRAVGGLADLPGERAVLREDGREALLDGGGGRRGRREGVDDGHLDLVRDRVEDGQGDVLRGWSAGLVGGLDEPGAQHLHLHC
ncbi:hypothetical protein CFC21_009802 [Triticum aestivum]|uniref:Uncharacterized protein n=2 Tax=Triticum aestivum TaxID=4565 RepID=A0A3B6MV27_WHEAT|nr:hypothetical protein CFC21_009802 [Triticum aestivum]